MRGWETTITVAAGILRLRRKLLLLLLFSHKARSILTCTIWCNSAQFHCQWVFGVLVVFYRMVIAPTAIKESTSAKDGSVGQIEPQIVNFITHLALPATGRYLLAIV